MQMYNYFYLLQVLKCPWKIIKITHTPSLPFLLYLTPNLKKHLSQSPRTSMREIYFPPDFRSALSLHLHMFYVSFCGWPIFTSSKIKQFYDLFYLFFKQTAYLITSIFCSFSSRALTVFNSSGLNASL